MCVPQHQTTTGHYSIDSGGRGVFANSRPRPLGIAINYGGGPLVRPLTLWRWFWVVWCASDETRTDVEIAARGVCCYILLSNVYNFYDATSVCVCVCVVLRTTNAS